VGEIVVGWRGRGEEINDRQCIKKADFFRYQHQKIWETRSQSKAERGPFISAFNRKSQPRGDIYKVGGTDGKWPAPKGRRTCNSCAAMARTLQGMRGGKDYKRTAYRWVKEIGAYKSDVSKVRAKKGEKNPLELKSRLR